MTLKAYVFPKLQGEKDMIKQMPKKAPFTTSFDSQNAKGTQTLPKSVQQHFHQVFYHSEQN